MNTTSIRWLALRSVDRIWRAVADVLRPLRVILARRDLPVIGYTCRHPIYEEWFTANPPDGFLFFARSSRRWLAPLERLAWNRVSLIHAEASTPTPEFPAVPRVMSCEGRPRPELFGDPRIKQIFTLSRHAGGDFIATGQAQLLRPAVHPHPRPRAVRPSGQRPLVLLAVGYGGMVKGFDIVARVYQALAAEFPLRLIIAGGFGHNFTWYPEITREAFERENFPDLERRLRADPHVTLKVFPRRILFADCYPAANIYLHLSRMDTFGLSALEAMSFGLPVVATRFNALPEMVCHEKTGLLIEHAGMDFNSPEWANRATEQATVAVRRLLGDAALRARMGTAGRERLTRAFDTAYVQRQLSSTYARILRDRGGDSPRGREAQDSGVTS